MNSGLQIQRLSGKIKAAWLSEMNNEDGDAFLEAMSVKIATAVIEEMLEMKVKIPAGIKVNTTGTAAAQTGATIEIKLAELS